MNIRPLILLTLISICLSNNLWAERVKLVSGDVLTGEIVSSEETFIELDHPDLGIIKVMRDKLVEAKDELADESLPALDSLEEPSLYDEGLLESGLLRHWKRSLALGLNGAKGDTRNLSTHIAFRSEYQKDQYRNSLEAHYNTAQLEGKTTANNFYAQFDNDTLFSDSPWFLFMRARGDWDRFNDWNYRAGGYLGGGYQFKKTEEENLRGRLALGGVRTWGSLHDRFVPESLIEFQGEWAINSAQSLTASNTLYPDLNGEGEYRNILNVNWRIKLADFYKGAALSIGIIDEYESLVDVGSEHNDIKYNLSLELDL